MTIYAYAGIIIGADVLLIVLSVVLAIMEDGMDWDTYPFFENIVIFFIEYPWMWVGIKFVMFYCYIFKTIPLRAKYKHTPRKRNPDKLHF